jgi:hypothetical protein
VTKLLPPQVFLVSVVMMTTMFESGYTLAFWFPASASNMVLHIHTDAGVTPRGGAIDALLPVGSSRSMRVRMEHIT